MRLEPFLTNRLDSVKTRSTAIHPPRGMGKCVSTAGTAYFGARDSPPEPMTARQYANAICSITGGL
jgi:hypothetical protein